MASLSIDAKEFVPKIKEKDEIEKRPLQSELSANVPEFVPKLDSSNEVTKENEKAKSNKNGTQEKLQKKVTLDIQKSNNPQSKTSKSKDFNPRHDLNWAQTKSSKSVNTEFNARHDRGWFTRSSTDGKIQKENIRRSDSFNVNQLRKNLNKEPLSQTYSTGVSVSMRKRLQAKNLSKDEALNVKSWSSIVKASPKPNNLPQDVDKRTSLTPNSGHSRDLRTMSYDVERDKRVKLNKLKKTSSLLGTLEQTANTSPKTYHKRLTHQVLTESRSLGPYDFDFGGAKPRLDIKRKSLVLKAKRSAGLKQDPNMDNWYQKDVPATIELFSTLTDSTESSADAQPKPTEKRKLTRTSKKVFSPSSNITDLTEKIISRESINDDYFFNDKYKKVVPDETTADDKKENTETLNKSIPTKSVSFDGNPDTVTPVTSSQTSTISYSSMVKKSPMVMLVPPQTKPSNSEEVVKPKEKPVFTSEEIRLMKKSKKKEKRKFKKQKRIEESIQKFGEKGIVVEEKSSKKDKGISLDLSEMMEKLKAAPKLKTKQGKKKQRNVTISTGVVSVVSGLAKKSKKASRNKNANTIIMDGATPIIKRGKERETPKRKKPTLLKKIIQAERERKRKLLQNATSIDKPTVTENVEDVTLVKKPIEEEEKPTELKDDKKPSEEISEEKQEEKDNKDIVFDKGKIIRPCEPLSKLPEELWKDLHSRKFREYCDHMLTKDINNLTYQLLTTLQRFQDRVYHETPQKFKQRRRFVLGLREVLKHTKLKKIKAVIVAPNMERISSEGGLDDYLRSILLLCDQLELPKIFALNRHALGKTLKKKAPVSVVGIFSYDGAQDTFKDLMEHVQEARKTYSDKVLNLLNKQNSQNNEQTLIVEDFGENTCAAASRQSANEPNEEVIDEAKRLKQQMIQTLCNQEK